MDGSAAIGPEAETGRRVLILVETAKQINDHLTQGHGAEYPAQSCRIECVACTQTYAPPASTRSPAGLAVVPQDCGAALSCILWQARSPTLRVYSSIGAATLGNAMQIIHFGARLH